MTVTIKTSTGKTFTCKFTKNGGAPYGSTILFRTGCFSPSSYPLKQALARIDQWLASRKKYGTRVGPK